MRKLEINFLCHLLTYKLTLIQYCICRLTFLALFDKLYKLHESGKRMDTVQCSSICIGYFANFPSGKCFGLFGHVTIFKLICSSFDLIVYSFDFSLSKTASLVLYTNL